MNSKLAVRTVVAIGIGSAVFIILGRFVVIPTGIPNTEIQTAYAFLALLSLAFGPIAGLLTGLIGHTLKDVISYGSPWWSWIISSGIVGGVIGLMAKRIPLSEGVFGKKEIITFNIGQVIANAVAWFLVAPVLDILIYAEPVNLVFVQGLVAGLANMVTVGVLGTALAWVYAKYIPKTGSLKKETD